MPGVIGETVPRRRAAPGRLPAPCSRSPALPLPLRRRRHASTPTSDLARDAGGHPAAGRRATWAATCASWPTAARLYERAARPFLYARAPRPLDLLRAPRPATCCASTPWRTMDAAVRAYFHSPYLRQLFNRYATYNGSSPYRAPATLCLIPYVELAGGGWYIPGGLYRLVEALVAAVPRTGRGRCDRARRWREVLFDRAGAGSGPQRAGVRLAGGANGRARTRWSSTPTRCMPARRCPRPRPAARAGARPATPDGDLSCSGFVLLLGLDRGLAAAGPPQYLLQRRLSRRVPRHLPGPPPGARPDDLRQLHQRERPDAGPARRRQSVRAGQRARR